MRRITGLAVGFFIGCCAVLGSMTAGLVPKGLVRHCQQEIRQDKFVLARPADDLVEVTPARWMFLPFLFGDFDLQMDLEVSEGAEIDLLLRQVEPRRVEEELLPFAGRFSVLRLSTEGDGVGWRTRDQALLGPTGDGVGIAAGHLATVWVEARGRMLRANIAGKAQPWFEADDAYGMLTMIAKGGKAVIHRLEITPLPLTGMWFWDRWTWAGFGVLGGLLVVGLALALRRPQRLLSGGATMIFVSWLLLRDVHLDLAFPSPPGMWLALSVPLGCAVLVTLRPAGRCKWLLAPLILIGAFAAGRDYLAWPGLTRALPDFADAGVSLVADRVAAVARTTDSSAVDRVFGPKAGSQISEAHGLLVRGYTGLVDVERDAPCVFMLGGQLLYDTGVPADHTALMLERLLRGELRVSVEVPALPTVDGYSSQQWEMFDRFYQPFKPDVVVLGIGEAECATAEGASKPRSSRRLVGETIRAARASCEQRGQQLVLFADRGIPKDILLELREHESRGLPLVVAVPGRERLATVRELAEVCLPFLKK